MSRYAHCPGEDCTAKVKIMEVDEDRNSEEINFCCVPCFQYTWGEITGAGEHRLPHVHSDQCAWRQLDRIGEPVVTGDFKIHTPKIVPPSRLGGNGGQAL